MQLDSNADFMVVHLFQGFNVVKCYVAPLREANFIDYSKLFTDKNKLRNKLIFQPRMFYSLLSQIGDDSHEVTFLSVNIFK